MKTVLITGVSGGIGYAAVRKLAETYEYTAAISRSPGIPGIRQIHGASQEDKDCCPKNLHIFTGSVADFSFVEDTVSRIVKETGSIDLLINNAAVSYVGLLTDMSEADWQETVSVNLSSVFNTCHAVVPHMVHQKSGRIVNISSVWGLAGASCEVAYSATKGGINAFTKALAKELAPSGIAVNAIAFGAVDTRMNGHLSAEEKLSLEEEIPAGRMLTADEAADIILKVAELPSYITGDIIKADGGWI